MFKPYWKNPLHIIVFGLLVGSITLAGFFLIAAVIAIAVRGVPADPNVPDPVYDACFMGAAICFVVWIFSIPVFVADLIIYLVNKKRFKSKTPSNIEMSLNTESVVKAVESQKKVMTDGGAIVDIKKEGEEGPTPLKSFPLNESPKAKSFKTSLFLLTFMLGKTILLILIVGIALIVGLEFLLNLNNPMSAIIPAIIISSITFVVIVGIYFLLAAGIHNNRKNTKASDMCINIYDDYFEQYYKFETIREGLRGEFRYKFQYAKSKTFETKKILAIKTRVNGQISAMILTKDDKNEAIDTIKEKIKAAKKKN